MYGQHRTSFCLLEKTPLLLIMFDEKIGDFTVCSFSTEIGIQHASKLCQKHHTYLSYGAMRDWVQRPEDIANIIFLIPL